MEEAKQAQERSPANREQGGIHPELMAYVEHRLRFTQQRIEMFSRPRAAVPLDNRLEMARADLVRLQAARESASRGDVRTIALDLQQQFTENATYLEGQRQYIEQHPLGTLEGDALYMKIKADILKGEKVYHRVKDDSELRTYVQEKLGQDRSIQATTERGKIMKSVAATQKELQQIQHLQQLLPQAPAR